MTEQCVVIKWGRKIRVERRVCERTKCSKEFWAPVYNLKKGQGRYCCRSCANSVKMTLLNQSRTGAKNPNWRGGVSGKAIIYKRRSVAKYPEREEARKQVAKALYRKELIQQDCVFCGETNTEAHHWDYKQPLKVTWLCRKHHVYADKVRRVRELFSHLWKT